MLVKVTVQHAIDGVMHEPIADACYMDIARLRVGNSRMAVSSVPIGLRHKFAA